MDIQTPPGIEPNNHSALVGLSNTAFELIKIIELERSGIRDGDGYWHGGDVLGGITGDLLRWLSDLGWLGASAMTVAAKPDNDPPGFF